MITLDQIKQLDIKVRKAIDIINSLTNENKMLQNKLDEYQLRIEELEILIDSFKEDQGEIENGIIDALNQLEIIDDDSKTSDQDSDEQDKEQENLKVKSDDESESLSEESSDIPDENKDNSDVELDIF